jgi:AraC family transcriptional regulator of adaptative response/methylated-DNA-[protein]-cysteine methyltransferase
MDKPRLVERYAANALAVAIPCRRVIRNGGGPSGYHWRVKRKRSVPGEEVYACTHW